MSPASLVVVRVNFSDRPFLVHSSFDGDSRGRSWEDVTVPHRQESTLRPPIFLFLVWLCQPMTRL